ncbi:hypothetical protein AB990_14740 [Alkalihalobacillus pseudalcaliphilus]|nr:hypothetical protein AB990_14740 [Alkalihalobacillus pseudalcaliphilus]
MKGQAEIHWQSQLAQHPCGKRAPIPVATFEEEHMSFKQLSYKIRAIKTIGQMVKNRLRAFYFFDILSLL